jgi:hypothetical protein
MWHVSGSDHKNFVTDLEKKIVAVLDGSSHECLANMQSVLFM